MAMQHLCGPPQHRLTVAGTERRLRRVDQVRDAAHSQPGEAKWLGEALSRSQGEGVIGARLPHSHCMFTCWWAGLSGSGPGEVISSSAPHPRTGTAGRSG
jgi:hypothetical protein